MVYLKPHQINILSKIVEAFQTKTKVLLNAACSSGKTIITLFFIKNLISHGKRIAIIPFSKREIRWQWLDKIIQYKILSLKQLQVICSKEDVRKSSSKSSIQIVSNENVSTTTPITMFIPQSIHSSKSLGVFDYIIIDEAHDYLDVASNIEGKLKKIIKNISTPKTKILGMTGTGHELMKSGGFFEHNNNTSHIIYDMPSALKDKVINDCIITAEYFNFNIKKNFYRTTELNSKGESFVNKKLFKGRTAHSYKLEKILKKVKGKTLIVSLPKHAEALTNFVNLINGEDSAVYKTYKLSYDELERNEKQFRFNKKTNFMIVIKMSNIGWDYPELQNVIDLTFTKNPKLIIQRLSRAIRLPIGSSKPISKYIYCADQSKPELLVRWHLSHALELTTKNGILSYDGMAYVPKKKMFKETKEKTIKIESLSSYYKYDALFKSSNKTILRRSLSDLKSQKHLWWEFIKPLIYLNKIDKETTFQILSKCQEFKYKNHKTEEFLILKCLKFLQEKRPELWRKNFL